MKEKVSQKSYIQTNIKQQNKFFWVTCLRLNASDKNTDDVTTFNFQVTDYQNIRSRHNKPYIFRLINSFPTCLRVPKYLIRSATNKNKPIKEYYTSTLFEH